MADHSRDIMKNLMELTKKTKYPIVQHNGQRKFGPPPDWDGREPPKGCEVFIGKLPREIYEDELVPVFSRVGKIYELRLMMDFSGSNRGYAFVTYCTRAEAFAAVKQLNGYEIRRGRRIGVVKSVDNCRLFVGNIPKSKTKDQVLEELSRHVTGIVDVILYKNCYNRNLNRGFAFVEFTSHRAAAMARRTIIPGCIKLWDQEVMVDWAEPEPDVDDEQMKRVKVLYARNFLISTTPATIKTAFEAAIDNIPIERIKKIYDYAFIHFHNREHAEEAMIKLQNTEIDGSTIEIRWAKPVDRELYRIQKMNRGNSKFNNMELSQPFLLYNRHLQESEFVNSLKDEGIPACVVESTCASPMDANNSAKDVKTSQTSLKVGKDSYTLAPAKLDALCTRYMWSLPMYDYQKYMDVNGTELWVCRVVIPHVGLPLLSTPRRIGPLSTSACFTPQSAQVEAAEHALYFIQMLQTNYGFQHATVPSVYSPVVQTVPNCLYNCTPLYARAPPALPMTPPAIWRSV